MPEPTTTHNPFRTCEMCGLPWSTKDRLKEHMANDHSEAMFVNYSPSSKKWHTRSDCRTLLGAENDPEPLPPGHPKLAWKEPCAECAGGEPIRPYESTQV